MANGAASEFTRVEVEKARGNEYGVVDVERRHWLADRKRDWWWQGDGRGVARGPVDTAESPEHGAEWRENSCRWKHKSAVWNGNAAKGGFLLSFFYHLRFFPFICRSRNFWKSSLLTSYRVWNTERFIPRSNVLFSLFCSFFFTFSLSLWFPFVSFAGRELAHEGKY